MENTQQMSHTELALAQNTWFGFTVSCFGFITPFISSLNPILQFFALVVSIGIGVLTIESKLKERRLKNKKK